MLASTLDLLYNLALLVALSVISGFIRQFRGARAWGAILQGALFGGAAVIGMMRPLVLGPGLIFDGRSVMLCLCGLFFGPLAAVTAGGMALLYRILLGGAGATMGVLVIASSVLLGLAFHAGWVRRGQALTVGRLLGLGLLVHGVMVLLMFTLPAGTGLGVIQRLGLPILLAYPLVTVLIGKVLSTQEAALRAIEALRNSKQQYDSLVSKIPVGIYLLHSTPEGAFKLDYASPRMAEMFGVSVEGLLADSHLVFEKIHPDDVDGFGRLNQEGIQERRPFDWKGRILIGETVKWLHISSLPEQLENGDVLWHGLILDITERKQAEDALRESNELLSLFLLHSPIHAYIKEVTPTESRVLQASENFREMIGIPGSEMVGRTMTELFPAEMAEKITADDWAVVSAGKVQEFPEEFNGRSYTTLKFPILQGGRTLLAGYTIDITHRRQAEEERAQLQVQLQQTQKMESLGSLAGGVAHDMNNVLGAILGLASAHLEIQPADSPTYRAFDTISQAALRGGKMVQSLLNFARQSPVEERVLDVNAILMEEVRLLERTTLSRVRLELDLALGLRPIRGDGSALTHAFMNLCVNAVDAMSESGTLTLRTRNVDAHWVEVRVEDTGTGMPREILEKALDPFFTTKAQGKGTGLGLTMAYSTVKAHGGQMEIESEPFLGTRVKMRFPVCEAPAQVPETLAEPRPEAQPGALSVLLVDDDELIQSSVQAILEVLGHPVTAVFTGEEALSQLEGGLEPDVVILDMNMPGLGGAGTLPRIRALRPALPVLLATGRADQAALDLVEGHPFVTLLSKPFTMRELQQHLEALGRG